MINVLSMNHVIYYIFFSFVISEIPQLRSDTATQLGCDAKGHSRAGFDTLVWYCVIVAGRPSSELSKMREVYFLFLIIISTTKTCFYKILEFIRKFKHL